MFIRTFIYLFVLFVLTACGNDSSQKEEHVWQAQENALRKAEALEDKALNAIEEQRQLIDEQLGK